MKALMLSSKEESGRWIKDGKAMEHFLFYFIVRACEVDVQSLTTQIFYKTKVCTNTNLEYTCE